MSGKGKQIGVTIAGMLFAFGWWAFVDGLCYHLTLPDRKVLPGFEDWAPGILATLGMMIISLIDKEALHGTTYDDHVPWRARVFLFMGFTLMAGGFAGSVSVLVIKYTLRELDPIDSCVGIGGVVQCSAIMLSTAVLWISQQSSSNHHFRI